MSTARHRFVVAALSSLLGSGLAGVGGCDNRSGNPSGGGRTPTNTGGPTSIYGKSAQMGKDVKQQIEQTGEQAHQAAAAMTGAGGQTEIGGLRWAVPASWQKVPTTSSMRIAEFKAGEGGAASVRFFAIGGRTEDNLSRWRGQVANPINGPTTKEIMAGSLKVHILKVTGTYAGMGPTGAPVPPQDNTRFLGAVIEGGPSPVQVVVTGPAAAVEGMEKEWEMMLAGIQMK